MFTFFDKRISLRQQRSLGQCRKHNINEQSKEEKNRCDFRNSNKPLVSYSSRHNHVEEIYVMSEQNNDTGHNQNPADSLEISIYQNQYREQEIHNNSSKKWQVVLLDSCHEISHLFRNIGIPNQHKLREPQLSPENAETKHEFRQIMDVACIHVFQISFWFQIKGNQTNNCNSTYQETGKNIPSK